MRRALAFVGGVLSGGAIGTAVALFFSPKSGDAMREGLRALQISERRWQGFYENTAVGIALANADGKITKANPALQQMLGYGPQEIIGLSLIEITEASERAKTRENVYGLLEGRRGSYQQQKRYERRDGQNVFTAWFI